jgi:hypothetical protein
MLVAIRDQQLVQRAPFLSERGSASSGDLRWRSGCHPAPRAEAAPFALCACNGGVGSQCAVAPLQLHQQLAKGGKLHVPASLASYSVCDDRLLA